MVEGVESLEAELQFHSLGDDEILERPEIKVPERRAVKDISALIAVLSRSRNAELAAVADVNTGCVGIERTRFEQRGAYHIRHAEETRLRLRANNISPRDM